MRVVTTMRSGALALLLLTGLGGCASLNLDGIHKLKFSDKTEAYPTDYRARVQRRLGYTRARDLLISEPQTMVGANAFDPQRWYVCLRSRQGADRLLVFREGSITGEIPNAGAEFCATASYSPLG